MCCSLGEHLRYRIQHTGNRAKRRVSFFETSNAVEVAEKFVSAVEKVNDHFCNVSISACRNCCDQPQRSTKIANDSVETFVLFVPFCGAIYRSSTVRCGCE